MYQLILEWQEARQTKTATISDQTLSKNGTVRIGRNPAQSDLVLRHPTVSAVHVEIFFNPTKELFVLRNLRPTNPPMVDGQQINHTEVSLHQGNTIHLGQVELKVVAISVQTPKISIAPTSHTRLLIST